MGDEPTIKNRKELTPMSYKVTRKNEAYQYQAAGHFDCKTTRLHDPQDVNEGVIVNGITHFLPGGGSEVAPSKFEMIYFVLSGEMTVTLIGEDGVEEKVCMKAGDSVHFGKGTQRGLVNTGCVSSEMMTIMIKPQA